MRRQGMETHAEPRGKPSAAAQTCISGLFLEERMGGGYGAPGALALLGEDGIRERGRRVDGLLFLTAKGIPAWREPSFRNRKG